MLKNVHRPSGAIPFGIALSLPAALLALAAWGCSTSRKGPTGSYYPGGGRDDSAETFDSSADDPYAGEAEAPPRRIAYRSQAPSRTRRAGGSSVRGGSASTGAGTDAGAEAGTEDGTDTTGDAAGGREAASRRSASVLEGEATGEESSAQAARARAGSSRKTETKGGAKKSGARKISPAASATRKGTEKQKKEAEEAAEATPTEKEVAVLIQHLQDPLLSTVAYRRIWEAPKEMIPDLITEVENPTPSRVESLSILVLDPQFPSEGPSEGEPFVANRIHGLGKLEMVEEVVQPDFRVIQQGYAKLSYGKRDGQYPVVLEKPGGFPVGVVIRAGLINRFTTTKHPDSSDDEPGPGKLISWWREFHELVESEL